MRNPILRRGNVMHRALFLTLSWWLVLQFVFVIGAEGLTATTTATTTKPNITSALITTAVSKGRRKGGRRSRVSLEVDKAKRQTTLRKRHGPYSTEDLQDAQIREPLYNAGAELEGQSSFNSNRPQGGRQQRLDDLYSNHDNEDMSHFYSPIKRQRYRNKRIRPQQVALPDPTPTSASFDYPQSQSSPQFQDFSHQPQQPAPKNYAFAYAVRDNNNAEDFSHKEARDGKLTMGEYRINLPDGRVQVVRYTAGGKTGYKADVTYESDDPRNEQLAKPVKVQPQSVGSSPGPPYYTGSQSQSSAVQRKYKLRNPKTTPDPYGAYGGPVYLSRPLKSQRPGFSPSNYDSDSPSVSPRPTVAGAYRSSPTPKSGSYYNGIGSTARPKSIYDKIPSSDKEYDDGHLAYLHDQSPRAGPARSGYKHDVSPTKESFYSSSTPTKDPYYSTISKDPHYSTISKSPFYSSSPSKAPYYSNPSKSPGYYSNPTKQSYYSSPSKEPSYDGPSSGSYYSSPTPKPFNNYGGSNPSREPKPIRNYLQENTAGPGPSSYTPIKSSTKGGELIPIEHFKAGPARKKLRKSKSKQAFQDYDPSYSQSNPSQRNPPSQNYQYQNNGQQSFEPSFNSPSSVSYKEPFHYYNSQHPSYHHGGYTPPTPPVGHNQLQVNPSASPYSDLPAGQQSFYLNTTPSGRPKQPRIRNRKKTSSGLVYYETPGVGPRPTALGVKEVLSRLPNMPDPKTSIHPYEVGAKDYGNSVSYKNSGHGGAYNNPSNNFDPHYEPHSNHFDHDDGGSYRDYLFQGTTDSIVQTPTIESIAMSGAEQEADSAFQFQH